MSATTSPASSRTSPLSSRTLFALVALYLVWSSTYFAMRVAIEALPPLGMAGVRYVVAGSILLAVVGRPSRREWLLSVPLGALLFLSGNGFVVLAQKNGLPSGLAAVVCATTPLVAALIGAAWCGDRPKRAEIAGIVLGVTGVLVLGLRSPLGHAGPAVLIVFLAPVGWATGSVLARRWGAVGITSAGAQMISGGLWLVLGSVVMGEHLPVALPFRSVAAWLYLVVLGSLVGFTAYVHLLRTTRPSVAMSYAYVNPVLAVLLGTALGGERFGWPTAVATLLIAGGVSCAVVKR